MATFPVANLLLKYNRSQLPRSLSCSLALPFLALALALTVFFGTVTLDPKSLLVFAIAFLALFAVFSILERKATVIRFILMAL